MSKTLGNIIDPLEVIKKYGVDALRYYLLAKISPFADGDYSDNKMLEAYNADLANGLGNLVSRVAKLCENNNITAPQLPTDFDPEMTKYLENYKFNEALNHIWKEIGEANKKINLKKPWELDDEKAKQVLEDLVEKIQHIGFNLQPFMPHTAEQILNQFSGQIKASQSLFPRLAKAMAGKPEYVN